MTLDQFREVIAEILNISLDTIQKESSFRDELEVDSLQMVNLIMEITQKFRLELSTISSSEDLQTVETLYHCFFGRNND